MRYRFLLLILALAACGSSDTTPTKPSAIINRPVGAPSPMLGLAATTAPTPAIPSVTAAPPTATPFGTAADQYRTWIEQARAQYPYSETVEQMWELMLCESSGDPNLVAGQYHGLFQYTNETWQGDWNPHRDRPILDPRAQIFATAKAWQDGYQSWWGCYHG
jgi:hypothetical protein